MAVSAEGHGLNKHGSYCAPRFTKRQAVSHRPYETLTHGCASHESLMRGKPECLDDARSRRFHGSPVIDRGAAAIRLPDEWRTIKSGESRRRSGCR